MKTSVKTAWMALLCVVSAAATAATGGDAGYAGYTDINLQEKPIPEVRFTTGKTICLEALKDGQWIGRYWAPDGRINWPGQGMFHSQTQREGNTEPAFDLEIDGQSLIAGWKWGSAAEVPKTDKGSRHYVVELENTLRPVKLRIHTLLDGTPVMVRWLEITNASDKPAALGRVSTWAGRLWSVPAYQQLMPKGMKNIFTLGYYTSSYWSWEGWFDWIPLQGVTTRIDNRKCSGADAPFFAVRNEAVGQYFFGSLEWSANYHMEFQCEQETADNDPVLIIHHHAEPFLRFKIGPAGLAPLRVIAPGETVSSPRMHLGHLEGDFDAVVQAMHDHVRRSVPPTDPPGRSLLVQYDNGAFNYGFLEGRYNENQMYKDIDVASQIGSELYILDAGWWDILGDWVPSPTSFSHGIVPIADYVHKKGMLFGIYTEMERLDATQSKVAKTHPEWFITPGGSMLDLTMPEAAQWMESEIDRIITEYKVDLYRNDYNPGYTGEGHATPRDGYSENDYWRYYDAFYAMIDRLRAKHPNVIFQNISEGGKRNDLGTAGRFNETYLTDGMMTPRVYRNYCGQALALPPEMIVIGLGVPLPYDYRGHLDTHLRAAYTLSRPHIYTGVAPTTDTLNPERRDRFLHYATIYKNFIRPIFHTCRVYNHAPITAHGGVESSGWLAMEYAAQDRTKGWTTLIRLDGSDPDTFAFKPRGLDRGKTYNVTFDSTGDTAKIDGARLMQEGLPIRLEAVMSSELLLFQAE